ncbi:MAG: indolepyruvate oxidoreductase subunit beta [Syntrophobacteraceae bacterium]|nr:indolepyruvate oxidoreductase subunit beta [Syntrophobacteraceae bacterium]
MTAIKEPFEALRIFFTGVGGQGTLLATRLVGEAALEEGLPVTLSEIHGMAQRGGVVESSVVVGKALSPTIADGQADILMAFEPMEAARALPKCHEKSLIIASTNPVVPFTVAIGQSVYPELQKLHEIVRERVQQLIWIDTMELARASGSQRASNIVMVGILAGTGQLPVSESNWMRAIEKTLPSRIIEVNKKAFEAGFRVGRERA